MPDIRREQSEIKCSPGVDPKMILDDKKEKQGTKEFTPVQYTVVKSIANELNKQDKN